MYADDTVLYVHGSSKTEVADKLTNLMVKVTTWLNQCCLQLNVSKTLGMFFTKSHKITKDVDILVSGEQIQIVQEHKYLGIHLDSKLNFRSHVKQTCKKVKFILANF